MIRRRKPLGRTGSSLSRGTPLTPGQPLRRKAPLVSKTGLEAGKGLKRGELVSKRPTRTVEERRARAVVWERAQARCERCGRAPATDWSHRKARSQGGRWCATNGLALCSACHQQCHASPALAYEQGWHVRSTQDPATTPVWLAGRGLVLLRADGSVSPYTREAA